MNTFSSLLRSKRIETAPAKKAKTFPSRGRAAAEFITAYPQAERIIHNLFSLDGLSIVVAGGMPTQPKSPGAKPKTGFSVAFYRKAGHDFDFLLVTLYPQDGSAVPFLIPSSELRSNTFSLGLSSRPIYARYRLEPDELTDALAQEAENKRQREQAAALTVELPPELEAKVIALAQRLELTPADVVIGAVSEALEVFAA